MKPDGSRLALTGAIARDIPDVAANSSVRGAGTPASQRGASGQDVTSPCSRPPGPCEPSAWYLRRAPFAVGCTTCERNYYGPSGLTVDISPPP